MRSLKGVISVKKEVKAINQTIIIDEAAAIFYQNGYKNTSLQEVANKLDVTRPALYHYFKSKEEIILAIIDEVIAKTKSYFAPLCESNLSAERKFQTLVNNHIQLVLENKMKMGIFFEEQKVLPPHLIAEAKAFIDTYYKTAANWYTEGVTNGSFIEINPTIAVQTILGSCNWAYKWYQPDGELPSNDIADYMCSMLLKGYQK
jgi:AcrR family transcriptional regulator